MNYALGLAKAAEAAGVRIVENERVTGLFDFNPGELLTRDASVEARYFIDATDSWIGEVEPDLGRYTVPIMNYNIATAPLPDADALLPSDAAVADSRFVLNYFRLSADKRLIFGGGVSKAPGLIPALRRLTEKRLAGFVDHPALDPGLEHYLVPPALGDDAGIRGAIELGRRVLPRGE